MNRKLRSFFESTICLLLVLSTLFLYACSSTPDPTNPPDDEGNSDIGEGSGDGEGNTDKPNGENDNTSSGNDNPSGGNDNPSGGNDNPNGESGNDPDSGEVAPPSVPEVPEEIIPTEYGLSVSESFATSIIYEDLKANYDTFVAYIESPLLQTEVYGIAFLDYSDGYVDEDGKVYFSTGFISFSDEESVGFSTLAEGLEIISMEEEADESYSYVFSYFADDVDKHCVINNTYITYGIVNGSMHYSEMPYMEGMDVDYRRGNLYNYDTKEYVYIVEEKDYLPISGVSLVGESDYREIVDEINRILREQEANLTYEEIKSYVYESKEAVTSYLLGLQEETFFGIPTSELIAFAENLDPMEHLQIGIDEHGRTTINIINVTKVASTAEKVIVSVICGIGVVGGFVLQGVGTAIPWLKPVLGASGGAIVGACMEAFAQVVISNTPVSDMEWAKIGTAAAAGAIAGVISIGLGGIQNVFVREVVDTLCDSVLGGAEFFANALIDGKSFDDACSEFGYGVVTGLLISSTVKCAGALLKGTGKLVSKGFSAAVNFVNGKRLTKMIINEVGTDGLNKVQKKLVQKSAANCVKNAVDEPVERLLIKLKKAISYLPGPNNKNWALVDELGNPMTKKQVLANAGDAFIQLKNTADPNVAKKFVDASGNPIQRLKVIGGEVEFDKVGLDKVKLDGKITGSRLKNFNNFDLKAANSWSENPNSVPKKIADYFRSRNIDLEDVTSSDVAKMRKDLNLTWHEESDLVSATLIPSEIHSVSKGGISHMGGIARLKALLVWETPAKAIKGAS